MRNQIQVKPNVSRLIQFLSLIEEGKFKIPTFQRDFIWENKEKIDLFDSISKQYPIGSILLWQPKEQFNNKAEIGPYTIDSNSSSDFFYILDGFQRLSTLFGCLTNPSKTRLLYDAAKLEKSFTLYYDLEEETFNMNSNRGIINIPVFVLVDTFEFLDYCDKLRNEITDEYRSKIYIERAKNLSSILIDYQIPSIEIFGGSIKDAIDIFSRINSKGITISQDWMLSALTSNEEIGFNLGDLLSDLLRQLEVYNFSSIKRDVLVQCISNSFGKVYFDQKIEDLAKRPDFKDVTYKTLMGIKRSVQFLFEELLVVDKKLLPYNNQLIFLTSFFNEIQEPNSFQIEKLKRWFWITTYSNYFTIYSLSKIRFAYEKFNIFIQNEKSDPVYYDNISQRFTTAELPNSVSSKSVRSNAFLLFLLNYSNNFNRIDISEFESYHLIYLFNKSSAHANAIPIIKTNRDEIPSKLIKNRYHEPLAVLIEMLNLERYFIPDSLFLDSLSENGKLALRMKLITDEERDFVEKLGIEYPRDVKVLQ